MITEVRIQNFKSFEEVTVKLGKFNVIIGPNNSGKSNFCNAFQLIHNLSVLPGSDVFAHRFKVSQLVRMEATKLSLLFNMLKESEIYSYSVELHEKRKGHFVSEHLKMADNNIIERLKKIPGPSRGYQTALRDSNNSLLYETAPDLQNYIVKTFTAMQFYRFIPSSIHQPAYLKENSPIRIDESGFGLPAVLEYLLKKNLNAYISIKEGIKTKFKDIEDINFETTMIREQDTVYQGNRIAFKLKGKKEPLESPNISDGISYFLLFLTLMKLPDKPGIVFIEEPENGIHPSNLKEIIGHIRELSEENNCQVIITTHSPYLLDFVKTEEVLIFYRKEDGPTRVRRMEEVPNIKEKLKYFMLGELWTEKGEKSLIEEIENAKN